MKFIRTLLLVGALLMLGAGSAQAVDPACAGATQADPVDLSAGVATFCTTQNLVGGEVIDPSKTLNCTVEQFDDGGVSMGVQNFTGGPGTAHPITVPRDGIGQSVAICTLDGLTSNPADGTIATIFPVEAAPQAPIILP